MFSDCNAVTILPAKTGLATTFQDYSEKKGCPEEMTHVVTDMIFLFISDATRYVEFRPTTMFFF